MIDGAASGSEEFEGNRSLTVLGCDGSFPGPGGAASGYLVQAGATTVWLDAGSGTLANLQTQVDVNQVDAIICSHEHPDHWSDVECFAVAARYGAGRAGVPVYAPVGVQARSYHRDDPMLDWRPVEDATVIAVGELQCTFSGTDHGPPTMAVRLDHHGASLAYSADCGPEWSVAELGGGIGTALCEATFTRAHEGSLRHLSGRQAGAMVRAAGVPRLVVTHRWPTVSAAALADEAAEAFGGPVEQAAVGRRWAW